MNNASEVSFKVEENDAPIRFKDAQVTCSEAKSCTLTVLRGVGLDGLRIGNIFFHLVFLVLYEIEN